MTTPKEADRICALINGEIEEHDDDYDDDVYRTEQELIDQQNEMDDGEEPEDEPEHTCYVHSLDDHHHSYIFTPAERGIFRGETTYTPLLERKKRR